VGLGQSTHHFVDIVGLGGRGPIKKLRFDVNDKAFTCSKVEDKIVHPMCVHRSCDDLLNSVSSEVDISKRSSRQ
jgi:hypothetical protein